MTPGSTNTTRTPKGANSIRSASETASTANFDAEYNPDPGSANLPRTLDTLTMRPDRRSRMGGDEGPSNRQQPEQIDVELPPRELVGDGLHRTEDQHPGDVHEHV